MAFYLIDGDNSPGVRTKGIEKLSKEDTVIIYYASNNNYYGNAKRVEEIQKSTDAKVQFKSVPHGKNSVDFVMAVKAGMIVATCDAYIFLLSEDSHFNTIVSQIRREAKIKSRIQTVRTIDEGIKHNAERIDDIEAAKVLLQTELGEKEGKAFWECIEILFSREKEFREEKNKDSNELTREISLVVAEEISSRNYRKLN